MLIAGGVALLQINTKLTEISQSVTHAVLPEFAAPDEPTSNFLGF
jgi:hypothetical protein